MAENPFRSKLKRKKLSAEDLQTDIQSRGTQKKSHGDRTAEPGRPAAPVWWSSEQLPAVEALWASALTSALPYLQDQSWETVPDLPEPSTARAPAEDDQRWCDLSEDVAPFPDPSTRAPRSPGPPEGQQDVPVQTRPGLDPPERAPPSLSRNIRTSPQSASRRSESDGGDEERKRGDRGDGQVLQSQRRVSNHPVFTEEEEEQTGDLMEEEEEQRRAGEDGGALQSCPMCMLVFPAGFTQMDRDGHLAQCLSEVNDDITW